MNTEKMKGSVGVMVTPFTGNFQVDENALALYTDHACKRGITALLPCASTGEFTHMTESEQETVYRTVRQANQGRKLLFASACAPDLAASVRAVERAKKLDYDACVVCPPYYYPLTQPEILLFYRKLHAAAEGMPLFLYHVPFFTTGMDPDTLLALTELPGIVGLKDSSANMKRIAHLCDVLHTARPGFIVDTGTDDCLLPALAAGCDGSMTAFGASMPDWVMAVYHAFAASDMPAAQTAQRRMMPLLRLADALPFPLGYKMVARAACGIQSAEPFHQLVTEEKYRAAFAEIFDAVQKGAAGAV